MSPSITPLRSYRCQSSLTGAQPAVNLTKHAPSRVGHTTIEVNRLTLTGFAKKSHFPRFGAVVAPASLLVNHFHVAVDAVGHGACGGA